jgi:transcriptional regulator with XRE-family HTH domain
MALNAEIITESRQKAKLSQEKAAEELPFSLSTLIRYENGGANIPDDAIPSLANVYHDKQLLFKILMLNPIYRAALPQLNFVGLDLRSAACRLPKKLSIVQRGIEDICDIAADGQITGIELPEWENKYLPEIMSLIAGLLELVAADGRM